MCCRFYLDEPTFHSAVNQLNLAGSDLVTVTKRDIYPSETAPVIIGDPGRGMEDLMIVNQVWGLPSPNEKGLLINARSETVQEKPTFSRGIRQNRCVIPARCFYEWDPHKNKASFFPQNNDVIYMAGLFERPRELGGSFSRFVILTREADEIVRPVHSRMPLLLTAEQVPDWIRNNDCVEELLKTVPAPLYCEKEYEQMSLDL